MSGLGGVGGPRIEQTNIGAVPSGQSTSKSFFEKMSAFKFPSISEFKTRVSISLIKEGNLNDKRLDSATKNIFYNADMKGAIKLTEKFITDKNIGGEPKNQENFKAEVSTIQNALKAPGADANTVKTQILKLEKLIGDYKINNFKT